MMIRISKIIISVIFIFGYKIYRFLSRVTGGNVPPTFVIVTYHSIKEELVHRFENQMEVLLRYAKPVSLQMEPPAPQHGNYVAVTFDDGFQSVVHNALPVLCAKKIPATVFVPTGYLGKRPGWIKGNNNPNYEETVLTVEQLRALPADLITIGSHSVSHTGFSDFDDYTARREITGSKETLEAALHRNIGLFSVPYAVLDKRYVPFLHEAGYSRVFINIPSFPATDLSPFLLGRISMDPNDWAIEIRLKFLGAYQWLPFAIEAKKVFFGQFRGAFRFCPP